MVNVPARPRSLLEVVLMKYARFEMPSWKTGILRIVRAIPFAQIRDAFFLIIILLAYIAMLVIPIWLSLMMPTGT